MFLKKVSKPSRVDKQALDVTKAFTIKLAEFESKFGTDIPEEECIAICLILTSEEAIMELYRHSINRALELETSLCFPDLAPLVVDCKLLIQETLGRARILSMTASEKKIFLEMCIHCIVTMRNIVRRKGVI